MIKILAFDLDGTLLDDSKQIPQDNIDAIKRAAARGVQIVPATGRIYKGIPEELKSLPFMRWFITANGSYLYDAVEDRAAARAEIPAEEAVAFFEYADTLGVLYDCYQDNWGYMTADMLKVAPGIIPDPGVRKLITDLRAPVPELKAYGPRRAKAHHRSARPGAGAEGLSPGEGHRRTEAAALLY